MDQELTRYLNDHLAGASGAIVLIQKLADSHDSPAEREFFLQLKDKVEADCLVLEDLLARIGQEPSRLLKAAGGIAARIAAIKLKWEEIELRRIEAARRILADAERQAGPTGRRTMGSA